MGIVRFFRRPYLHDDWLIKGLDIDENLYVHMMNHNLDSQNLHKKLNFVKRSSDGRDSFGTKRKKLERYHI